jgi:hypothetical protein
MKRFRLGLRLALLLVALASVISAWLRVRYEFQHDEAKREIEKIVSQTALQFSHQKRLLREYADLKHSAKMDQHLSAKEIKTLNNAFTLYRLAEVTPIPASVQAKLNALNRPRRGLQWD